MKTMMILVGALLALTVVESAGCSPDAGTEVRAPAMSISTASSSPRTTIASTTVPIVTTSSSATPSSTVSRGPVTITVLYDNTAGALGTQADWGFACLVEGLERTVLFDTGADGGILLSNMEALGIDPRVIEVVVLSHEHGDHTGGLAQVVAVNPEVTVYYPASFSEAVVASAREAGTVLVPVEMVVSVCAGISVTNPMGSPSESALVIDTAEGLVVLTGCAHPGVVEMVAAASELTGEAIFAVLGGFHLTSRSAGHVERVIEGLKQLDVERCGPAHCTGEAATAQMRAAFGEGFVEMGVGATITF